MKILQVIPYFYPAWSYGGPVRSVYELAKGLVKNGHEVTVFTTDAYDEHSRVEYKGDQTDIEGINVKYFKNLSNYIAWNYKVFISPNMIKAIKSELRNFDVIHLHEYRTLQNIWIYMYARKYGIPYVISTRGVDPLYNAENRLIILKHIYDVLWGYKQLKEAKKVIVSHKDEVSKIIEMGVKKTKISSIPNGINLSEYSNLPEKGGFRRKYSIRDDEKMILYVGRIHEIKGLEMLVKAFADLIKELDNVKLIIVGPDDGYTSTLKEIVTGLKIDDKVLFTGPLFEEDKLEAYVDVDVFVLPSTYESFGNVALEACACGTPVIVTDRCGVSEWTSDNVGFVVEYDKDQLRDTLLKILSDEGLRIIFGEEARKLVRAEFGWGSIIKKVEEVYESVQAK